MRRARKVLTIWGEVGEGWVGGGRGGGLLGIGWSMVRGRLGGVELEGGTDEWVLGC